MLTRDGSCAGACRVICSVTCWVPDDSGTAVPDAVTAAPFTSNPALSIAVILMLARLLDAVSWFVWAAITTFNAPAPPRIVVTLTFGRGLQAVGAGVMN